MLRLHVPLERIPTLGWTFDIGSFLGGLLFSYGCVRVEAAVRQYLSTLRPRTEESPPIVYRKPRLRSMSVPSRPLDTLGWTTPGLWDSPSSESGSEEEDD